ncbi:MAG: hypothetical protein LBS81_00280 [Endomicrobium sp.]|nr:hypothetical protein [Endomicrobium sp.]
MILLKKYRFRNTIVDDKDRRATAAKLNDNVLDNLRTLINGIEGEQGVNVLRIFMNEVVKLLGVFGGSGIRVAQSEIATTLQNDTNTALEMGEGKTIALAIDTAIARVLLGSAANLEILVGNGDLSIYTSFEKPVSKFLDFVGMKVVSIQEFKEDGQKNQYRKTCSRIITTPNTVVIMLWIYDKRSFKK